MGAITVKGDRRQPGQHRIDLALEIGLFPQLAFVRQIDVRIGAVPMGVIQNRDRIIPFAARAKRDRCVLRKARRCEARQFRMQSPYHRTAAEQRQRLDKAIEGQAQVGLVLRIDKGSSNGLQYFERPALAHRAPQGDNLIERLASEPLHVDLARTGVIHAVPEPIKSTIGKAGALGQRQMAQQTSRRVAAKQG
jgi:hypothetical protein